MGWRVLLQMAARLALVAIVGHRREKRGGGFHPPHPGARQVRAAWYATLATTAALAALVVGTAATTLIILSPRWAGELLAIVALALMGVAVVAVAAIVR